MWSKVGMGGEHHRYYKHNKFRQNLRGDPKFLVDLTRNDPYVFCVKGLLASYSDVNILGCVHYIDVDGER